MSLLTSLTKMTFKQQPESASNALTKAQRELAVSRASAAEIRLAYTDLLANGADETEISKAEENLNAADAVVAKHVRRVEVLQAQVNEAKRKVHEDMNRAEREALYQEIRQRADRIDEAAKKIDKVEKAATAADEGFFHEVHRLGARLTDTFSGEELCDQVNANFVGRLAHRLSSRVNGCFIGEHSAAEVVREQLTEPMRRYAEDVRSGLKAVATLDNLVPDLPYVSETFPSKRVCFVRPVFYVDHHGATHRYTAWTYDVDEPVADAAISQGLAFSMETPDGQAKFEKHRKRHRGASGDDHAEIKVDLKPHLEAKRERARAQWLKRYLG